MYRYAEKHLAKWLCSSRRKPLVLREARQVGKFTLIRNFASQQRLTLNEINLERHVNLGDVFASLDTNCIRAELEAIVGRFRNSAFRMGQLTLFWTPSS